MSIAVSIVVSTLTLNPDIPQDLMPTWNDAEIVVDRVLAPYRDHPAGSVVFDYHVCRSLYLR